MEAWRLWINHGQSSSLHFHKHAYNHFFVTCGPLKLTALGAGGDMVLHAGQRYTIPPSIVHQFSNIGHSEVEITEIVTPAYPGDIYRVAE